MVIERVVQLDSQDAVAVRDGFIVWLFFSDRLGAGQRAVLRPHLLTALSGDDPAASVAVPAGAVGPMLATPYDLSPQAVPLLPQPRWSLTPPVESLR